MRSLVCLALLLLGLAGCSGAGDATPARETTPASVHSPAHPARSGESNAATEATPMEDDTVTDESPAPAKTEVATFGAGCFWCVEAALEQLDGVIDVQSGYTGGDVADPTYEQVCTGTTGHAESVQVTFDPAKITYETLLDWFFRLHDPTTLNRQGADVGTQYRSAIFVHSPAQRAAALKAKEKAQAGFDDPIVTQIADAGAFYDAEDYHQDYYRLNGTSNGYCRAVIAPKLKKLGLE